MLEIIAQTKIAAPVTVDALTHRKVDIGMQLQRVSQLIDKAGSDFTARSIESIVKTD